MSRLPGPTDPGTPVEGSTAVRRVLREQLDLRLDQRPLTEAEAIVADRLALADLEAAGCDLRPLDDREPRELDGAEVEP